MATKNKEVSTEIEKVDKITFTGEVLLIEKPDEDTKAVRKYVSIMINNPFAELFEGGIENEYNRKIALSFKESQGKIKEQFNYKAKKLLVTCEKIEISGYIQRRKFYDTKKYKSVKYLAIVIKSPFDDGEVSLTISRAGTLGLVEMFADERLKAIA